MHQLENQWENDLENQLEESFVEPWWSQLENNYKCQLPLDHSFENRVRRQAAHSQLEAFPSFRLPLLRNGLGCQ